MIDIFFSDACTLANQLGMVKEKDPTAKVALISTEAVYSIHDAMALFDVLQIYSRSSMEISFRIARTCTLLDLFVASALPANVRLISENALIYATPFTPWNFASFTDLKVAAASMKVTGGRVFAQLNKEYGLRDDQMTTWIKDQALLPASTIIGNGIRLWTSEDDNG